MLLLLTSTAASELTRSALLRRWPLLAPAVGGLLLEGYSRAPPLQPPALPALPALPGTDGGIDLVVVLPGAGGPDANTARIVQELRAARGSATVVEYDWQAAAGDQLRAPYSAQRIGARLGQELAGQRRQLRSLHLVGVSVGAFLADAVATNYVAAAGAERAHVHLTLLDAFTARGVAGLARPATAFGVRTFGRSADFCECFLNTDDPVPSTSEPLRHAVTYDVTTAAARRAFVPLPGDSLHSWPAAYYGLFGARARPRLPLHGEAGLPARGTLVSVP